MSDVEQARKIVELMVLTAWADGHVEGAEALMIHKLVAGHAELRELGPTGDISRAVKERLAQVGMEQALRESALALKDTRHRELAFQCCAKVMGADGDFAAGEADVLASLQEYFALSATDVKRLLVLATR